MPSCIVIYNIVSSYIGQKTGMFETEERLSIYKDRKYKVIFNKKRNYNIKLIRFNYKQTDEETKTILINTIYP